MNPDRILDEFTARQYGVFSITQAKSAGMTPAMLETRIRNRAWVRLAPSVYSLASAPPKWERQLAAALLSRPGSIAAGGTAAHLLAFEGFRRGKPVIMVGEDGNARSLLARVIRCQNFATVGRARARGFEVTDLAETVLTLARGVSRRDLEAVVDDLLVTKRISVDDLARLAVSRSGTPGIVKYRSVVDERRADAFEPPINDLERRLHQVLSQSGVPPWEQQTPFAFRTLRMTVDSYIPIWRLIIEADGRRWHTRLSDLERDRRRDNEATANGFAVLRFTYSMLTQEPQDCLETLLRTGQVRAAS